MPEPVAMPQDLPLHIGTALARLREDRDLTTAQVARRMGEGAGFAAAISAWEGGRIPLQAVQLWRYLIAIEATFHDFHHKLGTAPPSPRLHRVACQLDAPGL